MKHKILSVIILFLSLVFGFFSLQTISMADNRDGKDAVKKILVVHSYHKSQKGHVVEMTRGLEEALKDINADVRYFHMDTKRRNSLEWKKKSGAMAMDIVSEYKPDIVITLDDNAQEYFAKYYAGKKNAPFFVFGGVNAEPEKYGFPAANVTGVIERPNVVESIELLQRIVPGVKKIVVLADKSPTSNPFIEYSKKLNLPVDVISYEQPETFDQWKKVIDKYKNHVDAFGIYVSRIIKRSSEDASLVPEKELVDYIVKNCKVPTVGFYDTASESGILCGISVSMKEQGYAAAVIAVKILEGSVPDDFEVAPTKKGRIQFNLKTAEYLNIAIPYDIISMAAEVIK